MITKLEKQRIDTENKIRESIRIIESANLDRLVEIGISIDADYETGKLSSVHHRLLDLKIMERMDALTDEA